MASSRRSSAGERVLEGRHVIGLFFLMLLFSGVFFTLGYVMGRSQLEGQVRAASTHGSEPATPARAEPVTQQSKNPVGTPGTPDSGSGSEVNANPPSSEWEFYRAGDKNSPNDRLKPASTASAQPKAVATNAKGNSSAASRSAASPTGIPRGAYLLQVVAVRVESEAIAVANDLRKKKFPAFVQTPQGDKYYRVQVGPYTDQKAMLNAKKGLETAGFKAIIKH
jgi:septal ring-binding cell division protein DamX